MHARRKEISGVLRVICRTEWVTVLYSGGEWGKPSNLQQYSLWTAARRPQSAQTSSEEDGNWTWTSTNTHTPIYTHTRTHSCMLAPLHTHAWEFFLLLFVIQIHLFLKMHTWYEARNHMQTHTHRQYKTVYCWLVVQAVRMYPGQRESPKNQWLRAFEWKKPNVWQLVCMCPRPARLAPC